MTSTVSRFERIESDFSAFTSFGPSFTKVICICPLASLIFPFTSAPATALPVCPSVTVSVTGISTTATAGPVSFKLCFVLKALNANRTSSLVLTSWWQPSTGMILKLRNMPQDSLDVSVSPPMEVMRKSFIPTINGLYNVLRRD